MFALIDRLRRSARAIADDGDRLFLVLMSSGTTAFAIVGGQFVWLMVSRAW